MAEKQLLLPTLIIVILFTTLTISAPTKRVCPPPRGTTPYIREIIRGRCEVYQQFVNPNEFCDSGHFIRKNCSEVTEAFVASFRDKPPCNVSLGSYDQFFKLTHHKLDPNKTLFWTGVYDVVSRWSQAVSRMKTLESTMTGYLINGLHFCAGPTNSSLLYGTECPGTGNTSHCTWTAEYTFWASASKWFAQEASGEATVMMNASLSPAYPSSSFLAKWEVPSMNPSKLSKVNIWMVTIPGQHTKETCHGPSILTLKSDLTRKHIAWSCTDQPKEVLSFLCLDHPEAEQCKRQDISSSASSASSASSKQISFYLILISLSLLT